MDKPATIPDFIEFVAKYAATFGRQAGVGGMETAGAIISYLVDHPRDLEPFLNGGILKFPPDWIERGSLTWHAQDGRVVSPEFARHARIISKLKKHAA